MANSLVMMQCSAMPEKIKRTSLTQEGIRILRNNSQELPPEVAAGHLTDLCMRMRAAGYNEKFRLEVIKSAMHGFERMVKVEEEGGRPVNRPRSWEEDRRQVQVQKHSRQQNWFRAGGRHVPVFVPHTPGSELAKRMRAKEEENNQGRKTRFLIVELGGSKIHNQLWKPNPWPDPSCTRPSCFPCKGEKGGDCTKPGVTYNLYCLDCQGDRDLRVKVAAYPERGKEHLTNLEKRSEVDSVLWLHSLHHHQGREDVEYRMVCSGVHRSPLDRQLSEKIQICRFQGDILMNRKSEMGGAVAERERWKYRRWGAGGTR